VGEPRFTLHNLVDQALQQLAWLPPPPNGQVRQIPDERTIRFYISLGLLDRPVQMRGRTALYGRRHLAQVVAIKRLQQSGRSLAEIQQMWPTVDDRTLSRISGVEVEPAAVPKRGASDAFWKRVPQATTLSDRPSVPRQPVASASQISPADELRIELAPGVTLVLTETAKERLLAALQPKRREEP
jgi:DNA-binding transcriptional MerR regulator